MGAVSHDDVVTAVRGRIKDRLVLSHEDGCDARSHAAEGRWDEEGRIDRWERTDGGERVMRSSGRDVVPCARVGELGLEVAG